MINFQLLFYLFASALFVSAYSAKNAMQWILCVCMVFWAVSLWSFPPCVVYSLLSWYVYLSRISNSSSRRHILDARVFCTEVLFYFIVFYLHLFSTIEGAANKFGYIYIYLYVTCTTYSHTYKYIYKTSTEEKATENHIKQNITLSHNVR